jgi:hypothetical protein
MTPSEPGPELDARRARVVADGLAGDGVAALTPVVRRLPFEALTPVKQMLKQFFSAAPWTEADDESLADAVGPGSGSEQRLLAPDLVLAWGWTDDRFRLRVLDVLGDAERG